MRKRKKQPKPRTKNKNELISISIDPASGHTGHTVTTTDGTNTNNGAANANYYHASPIWSWKDENTDLGIDLPVDFKRKMNDNLPESVENRQVNVVIINAPVPEMKQGFAVETVLLAIDGSDLAKTMLWKQIENMVLQFRPVLHETFDNDNDITFKFTYGANAKKADITVNDVIQVSNSFELKIKSMDILIEHLFTCDEPLPVLACNTVAGALVFLEKKTKHVSDREMVYYSLIKQRFTARELEPLMPLLLSFLNNPGIITENEHVMIQYLINIT